MECLEDNMCQAYEGEREFVTRWLQRNGTCELDHLRFSTGMCTDGRLCPTNDHLFLPEQIDEIKGHVRRLRNERKLR